MADYQSPDNHRISLMMSSSSYKNLFPQDTKKADHRYVRLQQIEHELKENELLSYCLYIAVVIVFPPLLHLKYFSLKNELNFLKDFLFTITC